jgi:hypothetical protein
MITGLTPRTKRLLLLALLLACIVPFAPLANPQLRHLRQVRSHIARIRPEWERFRAEHPGFDRVELFAYTDGDGMFGANGYVALDEQVPQLQKFMESTAPPRPVYVGAVRVVGPEFFELQKKGAEPNGAANRGQPAGSGTNRTSPAAGPGG